jgi:type IV pilus assembly protein PilX
MNILPVSSRPSSRKQQGVTLIVALIFLAVLTLLGVTAAQVMGQEERMAGNARNRDLAFQAAEAALNAAEKNVPTFPATFPAATIETPGSSGMYTFSLCMPNTQAFWSGTSAKDCLGVAKTGFNWNTADATIAIAGVDEVAEQPKYIVEKMPDSAGAKRYRVTARGVGGDANAVVILQAVYTYTP